MQETLGKLPVYTFLSQFKDTAMSMMYYLGGFVINGILLVFTEHEDKFDADPLAKFNPDDGEKGTPLNFFDVVIDGVRTVSFPNWHKEPVDHAQHYEKVAYMPIQAHYATKYIGLLLLFLSGLTMLLYILGNAILIVYTGFKQAHNDAEAEKKRLDANYEVVHWRLSTWDEQRGTNFFSYLAFAVKACCYILTNSSFVSQTLISSACYLGFFWSPYAYAGLLFIILEDPDLKSALQAVTQPKTEIMKVLVLTTILMYLYTVGAFVFFHDHFNEGDQKEDNMCNGLLQCFCFTMYHGFISSEMWFAKTTGDVWPTKRYDVTHNEENQNIAVFTVRYFMDLTFFFFVGVTLIGGVFFGIILDKYAELRQIAEETTFAQRNTCFICLINREEFDKNGASGGFPMHVADDHHLWYYIYFLVYLDLGGMTRDKTELNGPENYVKGKIVVDPFDVDWFPREAAMVLEKAEPLDLVKKTLTDVETMTKDVDLMKREAGYLRKDVLEMKETLKSVMEDEDEQP